MINNCARRAKTEINSVYRRTGKSTLFIRFSCPILYPCKQVIKQLNK